MVSHSCVTFVTFAVPIMWRCDRFPPNRPIANSLKNPYTAWNGSFRDRPSPQLFVGVHCFVMPERPKWFKGVVQGGKPEDAPDSKPNTESVPLESVPEDFSGLVNQPSPDDTVDAEELSFSLLQGWKQAGEDGTEKQSPSELARESDLVRLYLKLSRNPAANFETMVRPDRKREAADVVRSWSVESLHKYLSGSEVWKRPSYTKAIFEEISTRMQRGDMSPREE